jgi:hypothetical protein
MKQLVLRRRLRENAQKEMNFALMGMIIRHELLTLMFARMGSHCAEHFHVHRSRVFLRHPRRHLRRRHLIDCKVTRFSCGNQPLFKPLVSALIPNYISALIRIIPSHGCNPCNEIRASCQLLINNAGDPALILFYRYHPIINT